MLDAGGTTRSEMLRAIPGMKVYLSNHEVPPEKVSDQGVPLAQDGPVGFSAAVLPYMMAFHGLARLTEQQTTRMSAQKDRSTGLYGSDPSYYDQNLALFATGNLEGRIRFDAGGELKVEWTG
jgi:endoglucanase